MIFLASRSLLLAALFIGVLSPGKAQVSDGVELVKASLISSTTTLVAGQPFEVGVLLEMSPGWHTYWEYSGDAGLPTRIQWKLPPGFQAGPIQWPLPEAKLEPGDIQTYGYADRVLLITTIIPPADATGEVVLGARVTWLVCKDLCIPGAADLSLTLPLGSVATPASDDIFNPFRSRLPQASPPPYELRWSRQAEKIGLQVMGLPPSARVTFFPLPSENQSVGHPVSLAADRVEVAAQGDLRGVLAIEGSGVSHISFVQSPSRVPASPAAAETGLWMALLYGFIGGLILNLMPCVLPVISLKIFGFMKQAGQASSKIFAHGLAFVLGIFAWFMGLAILIIALKAGGTEVTWAFQFQNPWFNVAVGSVVFVFALNLFGVFEVTLPGRASDVMEGASSSAGYSGSFFQGVFATLLATPCTAPFLGTALGFAFGQSPLVILAMFGSVAAGMASPYLILSARPGWMKWLPKPGAWMERLKQFMGFPLLATLVWILSVLGAQRGAEGVIWFLGFLVCLAFACWIYGGYVGPLARLRTQFLALALVVLVSGGGGWFFLGKKFAQIGQEERDGLEWVAFSKAELAAQLAAGRSVFLDFTADWCITCKFNERTAIDTPSVRALLAERGVVPMKADWTNANPEITALLKSFGRVGVPFYVIYTPTGDPVVLPEVLTEGILLEALKKLP